MKAKPFEILQHIKTLERGSTNFHFLKLFRTKYQPEHCITDGKNRIILSPLHHVKI